MNFLSKLIGGAVLLIGGGFLIKALKTKTTADNLIIDFEDVANFRISGGKIKFDLGFSASNPTANSINIDQMFLDVSFPNGPTIAKIRNSTAISVPAKSMITKRLAIESNSALMNGINIITQLINLFTGKTNMQIPTEINITGKVRANNILSDYNKTISLKA